MRRFFLHAILPTLCAGALGAGIAHADIYTWTDESGRVNMSNLPPPDGVKVTRVVKDIAPKPAPRDEAREAALRQAEVQALAERVRQLQEEVNLAKTLPPAPPVVYPVIMAPPAPQYVYYEAPQPAPVEYAAPLPAYNGCDFGWSGCFGGWGTTFYPSNVVVVKDRKFPRFHQLQGLYPIYGGNRIPGAHTQPIANGPGLNGPGFNGPGNGPGMSRGGGRRG